MPDETKPSPPSQAHDLIRSATARERAAQDEAMKTFQAAQDDPAIAPILSRLEALETKINTMKGRGGITVNLPDISLSSRVGTEGGGDASTPVIRVRGAQIDDGGNAVAAIFRVRATVE